MIPEAKASAARGGGKQTSDSLEEIRDWLETDDATDVVTTSAGNTPTNSESLSASARSSDLWNSVGSEGREHATPTTTSSSAPGTGPRAGASSGGTMAPPSGKSPAPSSPSVGDRTASSLSSSRPQKGRFPAATLHRIYGFEDTDDPDKECMICYERRKNVLMLPCVHCSICQRCLRSLREDKCPLCRSPFDKYITLPMRKLVLEAEEGGEGDDDDDDDKQPGGPGGASPGGGGSPPPRGGSGPPPGGAGPPPPPGDGTGPPAPTSGPNQPPLRPRPKQPRRPRNPNFPDGGRPPRADHLRRNTPSNQNRRSSGADVVSVDLREPFLDDESSSSSDVLRTPDTPTRTGARSPPRSGGDRGGPPDHSVDQREESAARLALSHHPVRELRRKKGPYMAVGSGLVNVGGGGGGREEHHSSGGGGATSSDDVFYPLEDVVASSPTSLLEGGEGRGTGSRMIAMSDLFAVGSF